MSSWHSTYKSVRVLKGVSKKVGLISAGCLAWDLGSDYKKYKGFNKNFGIAAAADIASTVAGVLIGTLAVAFLPVEAPVLVVGLVFVAGVGASTYVSHSIDAIKEEIIGY